MSHKNLNVRRYITTPAEAAATQKRQREMSKLADNMAIAKAEAEPNQRTMRVSSIDVGIFNVVDTTTFNQLWDETK